MGYRYLCLLTFLACNTLATAQTLYFPPLTGGEWETLAPTDLGWCTEEVDPLLDFLEEKNTKAFIVLKDGRIVLEEYFGTFTQDSLWYWASAGKTITSLLVGKAQEEGFLDIDHPTSDYLGQGWTAAPPNQEALITVRNQLTMTTGLDETVPDPYCTLDTCLQYLADAGTRWYYHNAPYTLLLEVIESATGLSINQYTNTRLKAPTGMTGLWLPVGYNSFFISNARSMARYGLLCLNQGVWNNTPVLDDADYFQAMTTTSQDLNPAYGYLWWLNGKTTYRLPASTLLFNGPIIETAPADLIAGLGANDQKLYVVPSKNLVVIRMGNSAGTSLFALSSFDDQLWEKLSAVICAPTATSGSPFPTNYFDLFPNPAHQELYIRTKNNAPEAASIEITDLYGHPLLQTGMQDRIGVRHLAPGLYLLLIRDHRGRVLQRQRFVVQR